MIQAEMMERKPFDLSIYQYSNQLFQQFATPKEQKDDAAPDDGPAAGGRKGRKKSGRKPADTKNITPFYRRGTEGTLVNQEHNRLQLLLREQLVGVYGAAAVSLEHDFVDIKVDSPKVKRLYEVKSAGYASTCVEQALGQILRYAHRQAQGTENATELIVAGKYAANPSDERYIQFVRKQLRIPFSYIAIEQ
jgi:hypothetical protein